ncbi:membrane protein [Kurthia sp. 3B1D]|uniref:Membrane protein n=1 Tax=Candidatus Kurthia intestinigallinarum TaxID=1562256 RepID=A0A433RV07_9BACL|nr:YitT family protein [Kurthia sp. 3B1D]RUS57122.1 membrane protein [Kurthia sp. 3B1D]
MKELRSYSLIIIGTLILGISYNAFLLPAKLAAGGVVGISTILHELYGWTPSLVQISMNLPLFILGYFLLGKSFSVKTLIGTTLLPLFIALTSKLPAGVEDPMLASIYGGILTGLGLGLVFRGNGSTGGTTIIGQLLKKYFHFSSGFAQILIDATIVIWAMFVFNLELALYAMIAIFITGKVIDLVQLRTSTSKLVLIVTDQEEAVKKLIHDEIDRGMTKLWSEGGYSKQQKALLFTVVEQAEAVYLKELLQQETDSFVIFLNASDILGRGFSMPR